MLLSLREEDIVFLAEDRDYLKFGKEPLLIFKKKFDLLDIFGNPTKEWVYIKIKLENNYLPVISFHLS